MSTLLSLRRALGTAVDELAAAGRHCRLRRQGDGGRRRSNARSASWNARRNSPPSWRGRSASVRRDDVMEINPSQRTLSQIRGMDPRPGKLRGFDDYLEPGPQGAGFHAARGRRSTARFGEQLQSIFKHYSSQGQRHRPPPGARADRRRRGRSDRRRLPGPGRFRGGDLHARARHGRDPQSGEQAADQRQRQRHQDSGRRRNQPSDRQPLGRRGVELGRRRDGGHAVEAEVPHHRVRPEKADVGDVHDRRTVAGLDGADLDRRAGVLGRSHVHDRGRHRRGHRRRACRSAT